MNVMNSYDFQMETVIQCHGYFCYQTLQKTRHKIQDGTHLQKRHEPGKFQVEDSLFFKFP